MELAHDICLFIGQVARLKVIFNEATSALTDDVSEVSQFCVSLECCLRHHQRGDITALTVMVAMIRLL